jgi:hypothetical protein
MMPFYLCTSCTSSFTSRVLPPVNVPPTGLLKFSTGKRTFVDLYFAGVLKQGTTTSYVALLIILGSTKMGEVYYLVSS